MAAGESIVNSRMCEVSPGGVVEGSVMTVNLPPRTVLLHILRFDCCECLSLWFLPLGIWDLTKELMCANRPNISAGTTDP